MTTKIAIAIPSYQRPESLARCLQAIAAGDSLPDELLIVDNHSNPAYDKQALLDITPNLTPVLRLERNPYNIGLAANLLRCFERSNSDYIWICGDDDIPLSESVSTIRKLVDQHPECAQFTFSSKWGCFKKDKIVDSLQDYFEFTPSFANQLFISTSIYRRKEACERLRSAYQFLSSVAPHLVIFLNMLNDRASCFLSCESIVDTEEAAVTQRWSIATLATQIQLLKELPLDWSGETYGKFEDFVDQSQIGIQSFVSNLQAFRLIVPPQQFDRIARRHFASNSFRPPTNTIYQNLKYSLLKTAFLNLPSLARRLYPAQTELTRYDPYARL